MRKFITGFVIAALISAVPVFGQGSLSNQVLRLLTRNNTWSGVNTYDPTVGIIIGTNGVDPTGGTVNRLYNKGGNLYFNGAVLQSSASSGTVQSVALTVPSILSVSGSPVTSTGTLAVTLTSEAQNSVFAGPTSGTGAPTFRSLVSADLPDLSATYATASNIMAFTNKTGNVSQWTNDSGYITNTVATLNSLATIGTVTTGTWNATLIAGQYGGTGVANTGKTITLGGNISTAAAFTTSGANALTLTTTGATNVTLPTSGTLLATSVTTLSSLSSIGTITTGVWNGTTIGVAFGGTGVATLTGIPIASGTSAFTAATSSTTGQVLRVTGANTFAFGALDLANASAVTGTLASANGGTGVSTAAITDGQILIGKSSDHSLNVAAITGTANQVTVTNGAGSITLSTPQSIATGSTPQFARLGLGTGAGGTAVLKTTGIFDTGYFDNGNSGTAKTIDWTNGMSQKITLNGNCTFTINNPTASGTMFTFVLIQDGTGSRTVTWPGTVTWKGGSAPTLTVTAGKADIIHLLWNGTAYYGYSDLNF